MKILNIMSKKKYPSTFSYQMEATVFIILEIFLATCSFEKWEVSLRYSPVLAGAYSAT